MANNDNQKKYAGDSTLSALVTKIKELFVKKTDLNTALSGKADSSHEHSISDTTNLQSTLDGKVPTSRTVNSKALTTDITLSASDVGAASSTHDHDDEYYTQSQVDTKLNGKSDSTHNHDSAYAAKDHNHEGVYAAATHNHDTEYDKKGAADSALASAKTYADNAANTVKNDLLNNAGDAYDTLKELGDLIDDNTDAIGALETVAAGKADKTHTHKVADITDLTATATELNYMGGVTSNVQTQIDSKATSGHKHTDLEEDIADLDERMLKKVSKSGDTMTGNLKIQRDDGISPVFSMDATANSSGQRASLNISKNANSSVDNGTEIEDETFDGSTTSLVINRSAKYLADRVRIQERDANYSITEYALYGEHNKPSLYDLGAASDDHTHSATEITSGTMDAARLPKASETTSGIVTTSTQTFKGVKTFTSPIYADGGISPSESNTADLGDSLRAFKDTYTKNLYVNPQIVSGSAIHGAAFITEREGTTTTDGLVRLEVGNQLISGKTGNARGYIKIYNENNGSIILQTSHDDDNSYRLNLPDHAGTLATKDDLTTLASVSTLTTAEYTALEQAQATNANTLYMLTDAEEEGAGNFIINATIDAEGDGTVDKTAAEITAALDAGHTMVCNATYGTLTTLFRLPLLSSRMVTSTVLGLVFANQNYKVTIKIGGSIVSVSGEIVNSDITIGDTTWSGDEAIDFTDTINGMIDAKQNSNIFIAEYGVTTFEEIFEAVQTNGKTVFCRTSEGSILPLAYAYLDEIKFVGHTYSGEQEAICTNSNVWSLNDSGVMSPDTGTDTVYLSADKLFYYAETGYRTLTINGSISSLPNGWFGFLTVFASTPNGVTSSILETTSENGFGLAHIGLGNMNSYSMTIFKTGASNKLKWYLFKPLPSAEEASF